MNRNLNCSYTLMVHANVDFEVFSEICNFKDFFLGGPNIKISRIGRYHRQEFSSLALKK